MSEQKVRIREVDQVDTEVELSSLKSGSYFVRNGVLYHSLGCRTLHEAAVIYPVAVRGAIDAIDVATGIPKRFDRGAFVQEVQEVNISYTLKKV